MISIDFEAFELQEQMQRMIDQLHIAPAKVVRLEALLLLRAVVKFTHPKSRAQGRKAVKRDINRAITLLDPAKFRNKSVADLMRKQNYPELNSVLKKLSPGWKAWEVVPFDPQLHKRARDRRGRVQRFKRKFTVQKSVWNKYVSSEQKQVGSAKASWNVGIREAGGGSLPSWIAEHLAEGKYATTISVLYGDSPSMTVRTSSKGVVNDEEFQRNLSRAIETRVRSMQAKTERMLRDPLKYSNLFAQYQ